MFLHKLFKEIYYLQHVFLHSPIHLDHVLGFIGKQTYVGLREASSSDLDSLLSWQQKAFIGNTYVR